VIGMYDPEFCTILRKNGLQPRRFRVDDVYGIPETHFLPSKTNPLVLSFYDHFAVFFDDKVIDNNFARVGSAWEVPSNPNI
jgi:hypothetical protein